MKKTKLMVALTACALSVQAQAAEINWSGFLSVAAGKSLDDEIAYVVDPTSVAAYDREIRFDPESIVGIQAQAVITDRLRATVQLVSKGANDFDTQVEWAFMSYDLTSDLTLNAGRFRHPLFFYSDFLDVGYAYHWIRPPTEVYSVPHSALEGINLYYSKVIGSIDLSSQAWFGALDDIGLAGADLEVQNNTGINLLMGYKWFKLRLLYNETDIIVSFEDTSTTPPTVLSSTSPTEFYAVAFMADVGNAIFRSEATQTKNKGAFSSTTDAWYVSAGYAFGDFTPHATYAVADAQGEPITKTSTIGLAWNFQPSAVAKIEYLKTEATSVPFGFPPQPATTVDGNAIAIAIDLLF